MQSVFCPARGGLWAAKQLSAGSPRGGQKTDCTKPLPRRRAMGIESRRVSRRTWAVAR